MANFKLADNVTALTAFADGYTTYDSRYVVAAGKSGGQTVIGGTASGEDLTLQSTSHATRGSIFFGSAGESHFDEVNQRLNTGNAAGDTTNATRPLNLIATNATMRIFRVTSDLATAAPAVELIGAASESDAQADWYGFWDFFVGGGDSFGIRRRAISGLGYGDTTMIAISAAGVVRTYDELEIDGPLNHDGSTVGFYGTAPVSQPNATTDLGTVLSNLGLRASGTAYPLTTSGAVQITGTSPFGYGTGAGGTVTQLTNKTTGVTLNKTVGTITMHNAALAAYTVASFTLTNSTIGATDLLVLNHTSGGTAGSYVLNARVASGSATIDVRNSTGGSLSEAIVIRFAVIKGVTS